MFLSSHEPSFVVFLWFPLHTNCSKTWEIVAFDKKDFTSYVWSNDSKAFQVQFSWIEPGILWLICTWSVEQNMSWHIFENGSQIWWQLQAWFACTFKMNDLFHLCLKFLPNLVCIIEHVVLVCPKVDQDRDGVREAAFAHYEQIPPGWESPAPSWFPVCNVQLFHVCLVGVIK